LCFIVLALPPRRIRLLSGGPCPIISASVRCFANQQHQPENTQEELLETGS